MVVVGFHHVEADGEAAADLLAGAVEDTTAVQAVTGEDHVAEAAQEEAVAAGEGRSHTEPTHAPTHSHIVHSVQSSLSRRNTHCPSDAIHLIDESQCFNSQPPLLPTRPFLIMRGLYTPQKTPTLCPTRGLEISLIREGISHSRDRRTLSLSPTNIIH